MMKRLVLLPPAAGLAHYAGWAGLEVSEGRHGNTVKGLIGGALAWLAVVGGYAAFDTLDESGVGEPLFIGGMVVARGHRG